MSQAIFECCSRGDFAGAGAIRQKFLALEDMRDAWGPARVLHAATELAGIAQMGAIAPFVSGIDSEAMERLRPVAQALAAAASESPKNKKPAVAGGPFDD